MKITSILASVVLSSIGLIGATSARAETSVLIQSEDGTFNFAETNLGTIAYHGGLMERGLLTLTAPIDVRYLRFEMPSTCDGAIFEAGTITEGVADIAHGVGRNRFVVNEGRGMRTRTIFVSINGVASAGCAVSVFRTDDTTTPPTPSDQFAYTCLANSLSGSLSVAAVTDSARVPFVIHSNETLMVRSNLTAARTAPFVTISYDGDASSSNHQVNVAVDSAITNVPSCDLMPLYRFVLSADQLRVELSRQH